MGSSKLDRSENKLVAAPLPACGADLDVDTMRCAVMVAAVEAVAKGEIILVAERDAA
jgi:hypothetical protein